MANHHSSFADIQPSEDCVCFVLKLNLPFNTIISIILSSQGFYNGGQAVGSDWVAVCFWTPPKKWILTDEPLKCLWDSIFVYFIRLKQFFFKATSKTLFLVRNIAVVLLWSRRIDWLIYHRLECLSAWLSNSGPWVKVGVHHIHCCWITTECSLQNHFIMTLLFYCHLILVFSFSLWKRVSVEIDVRRLQIDKETCNIFSLEIWFWMCAILSPYKKVHCSI